MTKYIIKDWADNKPFGEKTFKSFEDAWSHVYRFIEKQSNTLQDEDTERFFEENINEYFVEEI